jgi:phosphohistidine phosphatase
VKLYFLRHGLAWDREEWKGSDAERPLTDEGKKRMERSAAAMAELGLDLDVIVTSPLTRAHQTAAIVASALQAKDKLVVDNRLGPGFGKESLAAVLRDHADSESVMLVGHEPGMSETISALIGGGRIGCKKGGLACVKLAEPSSLKGSLLWLVPSRILAP